MMILRLSRRPLFRASFGQASIPSFSPFSSSQAPHPSPPKAPASSAALVSKFQNPIVEQLWSQRADAKALHAIMLSDALAMLKNPYAKITTPRPPSFSRTSIVYPFSSNPFLRETYKSPWGTVRVGKILEDLDACAGNIAYKHCSCQGEWEAPLIVTAGVDRIQIKDRPTTEKDQLLTGSITWVGSSSMEITMRVSTVDVAEHWLEAKFTFVAREQKTNKATNIVPLLPVSPSEVELFSLGAFNALKKKDIRKQASTSSSAYAAAIEKVASTLLAEGAVLTKMPSLAPDNLILMKETELHNALIAQPQQRNMHNRIFGGFLMRRAFELAFSTAYVFGGSRPKFIEVDDISFLNPVDVGELLIFNSRVLYTLPEGGAPLKLDGENPLVMVEVEAWVTKPEKVSSNMSNKFHFTFSLPGKVTCKKVVPSSLEEGKRMAARMAADVEQAKLGA